VPRCFTTGDGALDDGDQPVVDRALLRENVSSLPGPEIDKTGEQLALLGGQARADPGWHEGLR
jgi:hypothetical protein